MKAWRSHRIGWTVCAFVAGLFLGASVLTYVASRFLYVRVVIRQPRGASDWRGVVPLVLRYFRPGYGYTREFGVDIDLGYVYVFAQEALDPKDESVPGNDMPEVEWKDWWKEVGDRWKERVTH
jgi:hypothetical protein